jgi:hypothetical protein
MSRARLAAVLVVCGAAFVAGPVSAGEPSAEFFRGINLNGPPVVIDGQAWDGGDASGLDVEAQAFEDQSVPLIPPTDAARALMIRSSRWGGAVALAVRNVPPGRYTVFLYVWEDNNPERFSLSLNGREAVKDFESGPAGTWRRLGPWVTESVGDSIRLTIRGGAANLSGIEIWRGDVPVPSPGEPPRRDTAEARHFDAAIAPLLSRRCLECHNASDAKGGLDLSAEAAALAGGENGEVIVAGKPDESLLWQYVDTDEMPKDRPSLSAEEKELLRQWIADGAAWGMPTIDPFLASTDHRAGYDWWSLRPVRSVPTPDVEDAAWPRNEIDRFVLARLEAVGLRPAAEADRRTLIRRLSFDLVGLPPSPEAVEDFVTDTDPLAYEKLVDRLLASPHYGERWGRHWLDVVRFGESQGFERNKIRENVWRYRDWVIAAFNADLPYDEFVRRQIAGDVLYPGDRDALIATGYHVCGTWDQVAHLEGSAEMRKAARQDHIEDLVATLGQAYLGLTVNCARCHDHKFDPISQREYYQVAALLSGVTQREKEQENVAGLPAAHVVATEQPPATFLLARGDHRNPKEVVFPAGLRAASSAGLAPDFGLSPDAPEAERRAKLAAWLTDPRNPLTPRVLVNRLWHHHFGRGIVDTPSDFGFNGGRPSHPELLDHLAAAFVAGGWRIKSVHRLIVTSAAYRQASNVADGLGRSADAENRLLWRAEPRRLEGEAVRDAVLAVSGALNSRVGGASYRDMKVDGGKMGTNAEFLGPAEDAGHESHRRTVYRLWARAGNNPMLASLDCPDPSVMSPRRVQTTTPLQALSLLNSPFMERCAAQFAERVRLETGDDVGAQVSRAFETALGRPPRSEESEPARQFVEARGLEQFCLVLFNTNEFLFVE